MNNYSIRVFKVLNKKNEADNIKYTLGKIYTSNSEDFTFYTDYVQMFNSISDLSEVTIVEALIYNAPDNSNYVTPLKNGLKATTKISLDRVFSFEEILLTNKIIKTVAKYIETTIKDKNELLDCQNRVLNKIAHLNFMSKYIMAMRLSLITGRPETLSLIGKNLNISKERVRQVFKRDTLYIFQGIQLSLDIGKEEFPDLWQAYSSTK